VSTAVGPSEQASRTVGRGVRADRHRGPVPEFQAASWPATAVACCDRTYAASVVCGDKIIAEEALGVQRRRRLRPLAGRP